MVSVETLKIVNDPQTINELWEVYINCFRGQEVECAQNQICFTREEFFEAMGDPEWIKIVGKKEGQIAGLSVCTLNLEKAKVGYINPEMVLANNKSFEGRIFYMPITAILPEFQTSFKLFQELVNAIGDLVSEINGMVFCDFSENKNGFLPAVTVDALGKGGYNPDGKIKHIVQDRQLYVAIKPVD